ncbi:MAG: methyl-accepting chemotaxis protein [Bdellovibrio sp.]|nr:methyl-accepting chemotaxis protein [Bdellovibrio sp.]
MNGHRWSLKQKIVIPVASASVLIVATLSLVVGKKTYDNAAKDAQHLLLQSVQAEAQKIESLFNQALQLGRASAGTALALKNSENPDRKLAISAVREALKRNKFIVGTCVGWEPNAFDGKDKDFANTAGHDASGRFVPYWARNGDQEELSPLADYDKEGAGDYYLVPKKTMKEWLMPPYIYPVNGVNILMTSAIVPILENGQFKGIIGVDIDLKNIQEAISNIKPYAESEASLVTNQLTWVTNKNADLVTKSADFKFPKEHATKAIDENKTQIFNFIDPEDNREYVVTIDPVQIGPDEKPWALILKTPYDVVVANAKSTLWSQFYIVSIGMVLLWVLIYLLSASIARQMGRMTEKMKESVGNVTSAISQLTSAGQSLSQASSSSAASVEETVASLEELTSMVKLNADNAKQAASLSASSTTVAVEGEQSMTTLIQSMQEISASSKQIEEIIHVIDDIAFQTNLLALNASVEAARAGEQGKGFAVVAEAVRSLAQRSAEAAKNITTLIHDSVGKIEKGTEQADQNGEALSKILVSIKKVSDLNNEIATASEEQATGIQQISSAMNQLDQSIQSNAASSEEIAATSVEINNQSTIMNEIVHDMDATVFGARD